MSNKDSIKLLNKLEKKRLDKIIQLKKHLYSNYNQSNDKLNWNMESMDYLIYFESCLEGLCNQRIYDSSLNNLVMDLIGYIKYSGFETNTEIKR